MGKIHYAWFVMIACCAIQTTGGIIGTAASNLFQSISMDLNVGIGTLTIYLTIMSLTMAFLFPTAGKLLAKNLRMTLLCGGICAYAGLAAMAAFTNVYQFYVAGIALGIGMSITLYMAVPILINMWFKKRVGTAMGIAIACNGCAAAIFSQVSGFTLSIIGWRSSFVVLAICGLLIYLPAVFFFVHTPEEKGILPYGANEKDNVVAKASTEVKGISFKEALHGPQFYCMLLLCVALCAIQAETPHVSTASAVQFGFSIQEAASMLSLFSLGLVIGNVSFGAIDDKLGHFKTYVIGVSIIIVAHVFLLLNAFSNIGILVCIFFSGFAVATFTVIAPLMTNSIFGEKDYNQIWAYLMSAASISGAIAPPLYGFIFDFTGAYSLMYVVIIVLAALALFGGIFALRLAKN